jgi:hypothetical protein
MKYCKLLVKEKRFSASGETAGLGIGFVLIGIIDSDNFSFAQ